MPYALRGAESKTCLFSPHFVFERPTRSPGSCINTVWEALPPLWVSVLTTPWRGVVSGIHIRDPGPGSRMCRIGEFKRTQQNLSGLKRCLLVTCLNGCGIDSRSSDSNALGFHGRATQCNHYAFHCTFRPSVCRYRNFVYLEIPLFSIVLISIQMFGLLHKIRKQLFTHPSEEAQMRFFLPPQVSPMISFACLLLCPPPTVMSLVFPALIDTLHHKCRDFFRVYFLRLRFSP